MKELSVLIKTFQRKDSLWRLLKSIESYYPNLQILILDDSKKDYKEETLVKFNKLDINYIVTEFDIGLSKGRNILLNKVNTKYFLLCEDDFEFDDRTNLRMVYDIIRDDKNNIDILGGKIYNIVKLDTLYSFLWAMKKPKRFKNLLIQEEVPAIYNGEFKIDNKDIILYLDKEVDNFSNQKIYTTDIVVNFFIAKTDKVRTISGWQPEEVKIGEHQFFFLRLKKAGINVAFTPAFAVKHYPRKTMSYNRYRLRTSKMFNYGLESLEYIDTYRVIDQNNNQILHWRRNN